MSCQLEILQTCISSFMMGLINHKQISKKLMKKCKIFDYLCKKFPLDQSQLENYSKNIAFNSTTEVERKFIQNNLLDLFVFNKCVSMESSVVQLSNSGSTTILDTSAECLSPYLFKLKNNLTMNQIAKETTNYNDKDTSNYYNLSSSKSIPNIQDQSFNGGILNTTQGLNQLISTAPAATVQHAQKIENISKPQIAPLSINQPYGLGTLQSPNGNEYSLTARVNNYENKQQGQTLNTLQSPSINVQANNTTQVQNYRFHTLQTPSAFNAALNVTQDDVKINQFTLGSNNKVQNIISNPNTQAINSNNNNQKTTNHYYPMSIKPINFKMTMSNQKTFSLTQNSFETNTQGQLAQQFNSTLNNISQQDLLLKSVNTSEKVNTFNPSNLLQKLKGTISTFKENSEKINTLMQQTTVTESVAAPYIMNSQRTQPNLNVNTNLQVNNKPYIQQTPSMNNQYTTSNNNVYNMRLQNDNKRKSYLLKKMSIYQQNNQNFRKINV